MGRTGGGPAPARPLVAARLIAAATLLLGSAARAQELEPRSYASAPIGLQVVVLGAGHADGDLIFDPALPIEDAEISLDLGVAGYGRTFALFGKVGRVGVAIPWFDGEAAGLVAGVHAERRLVGAGDPRVSLGWMFYGAPAQTAAELVAGPRSPTVAGVTVTLGLPLGEYDRERLLNIGNNRWMLRTELGASHRIGHFWIEGAAAVSLFTDNDEFYGSKEREQAPIWSAQSHLVWEARSRLWLALDYTYYWGGQVRVDGVRNGRELANSRAGVTASIPCTRRQSVKLSYSRGVLIRTGADTESIVASWQLTLFPRAH